MRFSKILAWEHRERTERMRESRIGGCREGEGGLERPKNGGGYSQVATNLTAYSRMGAVKSVLKNEEQPEESITGKLGEDHASR